MCWNRTRHESSKGIQEWVNALQPLYFKGCYQNRSCGRIIYRAKRPPLSLPSVAAYDTIREAFMLYMMLPLDRHFDSGFGGKRGTDYDFEFTCNRPDS